jgi:hypothetical protein
MPFGSRRFLAGRTLNPAVTTIDFIGPRGGSAQAQSFQSVVISNDDAGNTMSGNGTYTAYNSGTENLAHGQLGELNGPICVPLKDQRTYTVRIIKTGTGAKGDSPTLTIGKAGEPNPAAIFTGGRPFIRFSYGRIGYFGGTLPVTNEMTQLFLLTNHDTSSDVAVGSGPYEHTVNFSNAMSGISELLVTDSLTVAHGDQDPSGGYTARGLYLEYGIDNFGLGSEGDVRLEVVQT